MGTGQLCSHDGGTVCLFDGKCVKTLSMSLGEMRTCGVTVDGKLYCWGASVYGGPPLGGLGGGPELVTGLPRVVAVALGYGHACALTAAGTLHCWGFNHKGQLGAGSTLNKSVPVQILDNVVSIAAGEDHTCAITSAGSVKCWGWNESGQVGNDSTDDALFPVDINTPPGFGRVTDIDLGYAHSCAISEMQELWCWGSNSHGQLGTGLGGKASDPGFDFKVDSLVPMRAYQSGVQQVSCGHEHTCIVTGTYFRCFGSNEYGQIGLDPGYSLERDDLDFIDTSGYDSGTFWDGGGTCTPELGWSRCKIQALKRSTCVSDGLDVFCYGLNNRGVLGDGTFVSRYQMNAVLNLGGGTELIDLSAAFQGSCVLHKLGTSVGAKCWGANYWYQLGVDPSHNVYDEWDSVSSPQDVIGFPP